MNESISPRRLDGGPTYQVSTADLFAYDQWEPRISEWTGGPLRGASPFDHMDFHVDLGCGRVPKGRIGVDRYPAPGVAVVADLDKLLTYGVPAAPGEDAGGTEAPSPWIVCSGLPFADSSIESIISHHVFEHMGDGFIPLMDEIYRVLKPGGVLRAITPLFPSWSAVADPDHRRYFLADGEHSTWDVFCGTPGDGPENCWLSSFMVPYTKARFVKREEIFSPRVGMDQWWTSADSRELRVALEAVK